MKLKKIELLTALLLALPLHNAEAGSRYETPPPTQLSPDLASPWLLQLKQPSSQQRARKVQQPAAQPRRKNSLFGSVTATQRRQHKQPTGIFAIFAEPNPKQQPVVVHRKKQNVVGLPVYNRKKKQLAYASEPAPTPVPERPKIDPKFHPQTVSYESNQKVGTIIVDTNSRFLYLVLGDSTARRYGVGVGKEGFEWRGTHNVTRKAEWPSWRPPQEMIKRERAKGRELPAFMEGGPANPLGARAIYIGDTLYRIHGTNQPWTIGQAVSSGCIRMRNEDVMDLYERVKMGAKVIVS